MSISSQYKYSPLPSRTSFRLLNLLPGNDNDAIAYSLVDADWEVSSQYEAISYAWGDIRSKVSTYCEGKILKITKSLYDALFHLRWKDRLRVLWADAVYIDQTNSQERETQVNNMSRIYQNATKVMIWLGEDEDGQGEEAIEYIKQTSVILCNHAGISPTQLASVTEMNYIISLITGHPPIYSMQTNPRIWKSLRWFFSRPWFSRLWVIQEANAGPIVRALCGNNSVDWHAITLIAELFVRKADANSDQHLTRTYIWHAAAMRYCEFRQRGVLVEMLDFARNFLASDERDKIYALLGLPAFASGSLKLSADYTKSTQQVYRDLAEAVISSSDSLGILTLVQHHQAIETPSWIPKWNFKQQANVIFREFLRWDASKRMPMSISFDKLSPTLRTLGIKLDVVSEEDEIDLDKLYPIPGSDNTASEEYRAAFWRHKASGNSAVQNREWLETYSMVFTWGLDGNWEHVDNKEQAADFQDYLRNLCSVDLPFCEELCAYRREYGSYEYSNMGRRVCWGRSFFKTEIGYIGLGPRAMKTGDIVCVLFGCRIPMILRPENNYYLLVSEAYVHGIMNGEAIERWKAGELDNITEEEFEIH